MKHLALYRKWRPQRFADVVGQEHISRTLLNSIRQDRLAHAYLFCGPRGTGKTTSARLLAKALNCMQPIDGEPCNVCANCEEITAGHSLDVIEIDAASNRGIDSARELREQVRFTASGGRYRVFIIDEFHMLTKEAFNALLKTLEEPPENVIFVLATTEPHEVLQTVVSRCQRFDFQRISVKAMREHLQRVAEAEQIGVSSAALEAMARKANGGLRDGMSLLDQVRAVGMPGEPLPDQLVYQSLGLVQEDALLALLQGAFRGEIEVVMANLRGLLEQGHDAMQILAELIQLLRHLSLAALPPERLEELGVPSHLLETVKSLGASLSRGQIVSALDQLLRTSDRLHHCAQPDIWLEADLICLSLQGDRSLLERVEALEHGQPPVAASRPLARPAERQTERPAPAPPRESQMLKEAPPLASEMPPAALPEPAYQAAPQPGHEPITGRPDPVWVPPAEAAAPPTGDLNALWRAFLEKVKETQRPLIGFLLNGRLAQVSREHQLWILEFNSKPHCERVRQSLKSGKLQQLASALMGETYGIEARLAGGGPGQPERGPAPASAPAAPPPARPAPARAVQEPVAAYRARPQTASFDGDVDMDFMPEDPDRPSRSESALRTSAPGDFEQAPVAIAAPPREARPRPMPPEALPAEVRPQPIERAPAAAPPTESRESIQSPPAPAAEREVADLGYAKRHPVEAVAELFKGKIIHKRG